MPHRARPDAEQAAPSPLGQSVFFRLIRLVNLTARPFLDRIGRAHALTLPEWRAMVVLASRPGVTGAEIAAESGLDKMAVSRALASLERAGRIERRADPTDRRMGRVSLSASGLKVYRAIEETAREREADIFRGIEAAEQAALAATIQRMTENLMTADKP